MASRVYQNPEWKNPTPLRVGMTGRFDGRDYTVRARLVKGMTEEGVVYYWHEFQLVAPDGDEIWIEFENDAWKKIKAFMPRTPVGPREAVNLHAGSSVNLDGNSVRVTENDRAQLYAVEGEPTFSAVPGDKSQYVDAGYGNHIYAVEWTREEIEFFRGENIATRDIYVGFGLTKELDELDRIARKRRSQNIFATLCVGLSLIALVIWGASSSSGRVLFRGTHPLTAINPVQGVRFGPITLDTAHPVHRLSISANMTQSSAWAAGVLEAADGEELMAAQRDFWDESGYDDGQWHESDLHTDVNFLAERAGPYYVRLYAEPDADSISRQYGDISYEVRSGVVDAKWLGWFGFMMLFVGIGFYVIASQQQLSKWAAAASDD
ncbi:MAG: hypothetical protein JWN98_2583 [Abditibacteriota bacterium]|nr:hypothetical protein [Abditibacteriota bacterium]